MRAVAEENAGAEGVVNISRLRERELAALPKPNTQLTMAYLNILQHSQHKQVKL